MGEKLLFQSSTVVGKLTFKPFDVTKVSVCRQTNSTFTQLSFFFYVSVHICDNVVFRTLTTKYFSF